MNRDIRADFPLLSEAVRGKPLAYLDNAATTQKPQTVLEAMDAYYRHDNANVSRGVHTLGERATAAFERARATVADFINADPEEIVFLRGTTEGINLVASSLRHLLKKGDEIILTEMEHHSNIVPWQLLRDSIGIILKVVPVLPSGELDFQKFEQLLSHKTKLVSLIHVSNVLGTINALSRFTQQAHAVGAWVLIDGAQAVSHLPVNVRELDCDFYVFSGHKLYGPTGIGILYGRKAQLAQLPPYQGGGGMVEQVRWEKTTYLPVPYRFEAGTPNIAGAVGLASAIRYIQSIGFEWIRAHETGLMEALRDSLQTIPGVTVFPGGSHVVGAVSFVMEGIHAHDVATIVDQEGVAVRAGHHCAMPLTERLGVPATVRASLGIYNQKQDIDQLHQALLTARRVFGPCP